MVWKKYAEYDEKIDLYSATEEFNVLMYENLALEKDTYVIRVMVTGETSGNPSNACVGVSRAYVYKNGRGEKADCSALERKLAEMKTKDLSAYSQDIQLAYADALNDAQYLLGHSMTVEDDVNFGLAVLEEAEKLLEILSENKFSLSSSVKS